MKKPRNKYLISRLYNFFDEYPDESKDEWIILHVKEVRNLLQRANNRGYIRALKDLRDGHLTRRVKLLP